MMRQAKEGKSRSKEDIEVERCVERRKGERENGEAIKVNR